MSSNEKNSSWKKRTMAMSSNGSGPSGIGSAERLADRQPRHVDAGADGERHRAGEARVDLEQGGLAGRRHP